MSGRTTGVAALAWVVVVLLGACGARAEGPGARKVLVEFGWDEPDTAFLRRHIAEMERTPFDGCVFHAFGRGSGGEPINLTWSFWGRRGFTREEFAGPRADLAATSFGRFRHNFLRVNTTPADLDWFDDFASIVVNARLAAALARDGHARGVLLDTEAYEKSLFHYSKQARAKDRSWDEYAAQARRRGSEVMAAFQEGFPGLTVLLTFGPSYARAQTDDGKRPLAETEYGLLVPFVEGMVEAVRGGATIVDGHEPSYGYREPGRFDAALRNVRAASPRLEAGFGIWLDFDWRRHGWDERDPSRNYFTPDGFERAARAALERSDGIVWVYTETPRWWTDRGGPAKLPAAYPEALRRARKGISPE